MLLAVGILGFSLGRSSGPWRWSAAGTLAYDARCSNQGHAQVPDTCVFEVANPPTLSRNMTFDVRVRNTGASRVCYGISVTTSYLSGLQSFCVKPHASGGYETTNQARFFVDFSLDLFATTNATRQPLAPMKEAIESPFVITFSQPSS